MTFDLIVRGGRVIDPAHGIDAVLDVGVKDGRIAGLAEHLPSRSAARVLDADGLVVTPGLIDLHMHASSEFNGEVAHAMLARAGVTTALDMAGPIQDVLQIAAAHGAGLNLACLNRVKPGELVPDPDPTGDQVGRALASSLDQGALGVKVLGGHFPLTPTATRAVFEQANRAGCWVAFHCGTTETGSNLHGLREVVELGAGLSLHVAHINSYCRGAVLDSAEEAREALALLGPQRHLVTESYLAVFNGTWAHIEDGRPASGTSRNSLVQGGYPATEEGMRRAIAEGFANIHVREGDGTILLSGDEAVRLWEKAGTATGVSFSVNPPLPRMTLAVAKDASGRFVVDALATDGGGIPRNDLVASGMQLVRLRALSLSEFAHKASLAPARLLGLPRKGHLGEGADADLTVIDMAESRVRSTIVGGRIVMHAGQVFGSGTTVLTTERGASAVEGAGLAAEVVDLAQSGFYRGKDAVA